MPISAVSPRRRSRKASGCFARLRSKYGWCCRRNRREKKTKNEDVQTVSPAGPLEQLFFWAVLCRRITRPAAWTRAARNLPRETVHNDVEGHAGMFSGEVSPAIQSAIEDSTNAEFSTSPTTPSVAFTPSSGSAKAGESAISAVSAAGGSQAKVDCSTLALATAYASLGEAGRSADATGVSEAELAQLRCEDDEEELMAPMVGFHEKVEAATFMPRAIRGSDDTPLRKWESDDLKIRGVDAGIGGGTFAEVVLGKTSKGMPVAIKVINRNNQNFGCQDKYIDREIQTLTMSADHPNVVDLLGTVKTDYNTFMIMPLIKTDMGAILKEKVLVEEEAIAIALQLMSAMEHVHSENIVHRDLKPANLLLTHDNKVRLADFGFAKILEEGEDTMTGLCGTKPYLSPEQVNNLPYGIAADMWAAGVVVYELLMGVTAFCPDSSIDLGPVAKAPPPEEGDIQMRLDPYDELERENIRAGVFSVDLDRVGAEGEDFLRKLIVLDPAERMSARQASEHVWLGGIEAAVLRRAGVGAVVKKVEEATRAEREDRARYLRNRRRRKVKMARAPAPVAGGALGAATVDLSVKIMCKASSD